MRLWRNPNQTASHRSLVDDLFQVGAAKPLGYLPLNAIIHEGYEHAKVAADLKNIGIRTRICTGDECSIESGACMPGIVTR